MARHRRLGNESQAENLTEAAQQNRNMRENKSPHQSEKVHRIESNIKMFLLYVDYKR